VKLSVIIPAYNEENYLPRTLDELATALRSSDDSEVIVVDNESTDATRKIASSSGARVVDEHEHNIGKVRNTGEQSSHGAVIVFLDADTIVRPGLFEKILDVMSDPNCFGGSVAVEYEAPVRRPLMRFFMKLWPILGKFTNMRGGALQFCRREVFEELNGYDTTIYVGEDIDFHWRLDKLAGKRGGFTAFIESPPVLTSSRRWEKMGLLPMLFYTHPVTIFVAWRIRSFWKDWYENAIR
jgi:glycosyltransferase involved in cell wall biosynthesis